MSSARVNRHFGVNCVTVVAPQCAPVQELREQWALFLCHEARRACVHLEGPHLWAFWDLVAVLAFFLGSRSEPLSLEGAHLGPRGVVNSGLNAGVDCRGWHCPGLFAQAVDLSTEGPGSGLQEQALHDCLASVCRVSGSRRRGGAPGTPVPPLCLGLSQRPPQPR